MRHIAFFVALGIAAPAFAQRRIEPADPVTESPSAADTSNPASLGDAEKEEEGRVKMLPTVRRPKPVSRGTEGEYLPPHEPEEPRR